MIRGRATLLIASLAAAGLFVGSGACLVAPGEVAVVRRAGRLVLPPWEPGLHWRLPFGIDRVDRVRALEVRQLTIGLSGPASTDFEPSTGEFMTGDLNILQVQATIQYRAADPAEYVLRAEKVEPLLASAAEAALTRAVAFRSVDAVLRTERQTVAQDVERDLQSTAKAHRLGVAILEVNLTDTRPPFEVQADFASAQSAESQRDRRINEAKSYAETTATVAQSKAQAILEAAHAAAKRRILTASAQAERFGALLAETQRAPSLTIRRIYIESLQALLDRVKAKIVLPPGDSVDLTVLGNQDAPAGIQGK
jgi:membrane protease subunit HflK